jgi:hypothetical protein
MLPDFKGSAMFKQRSAVKFKARNDINSEAGYWYMWVEARSPLLAHIRPRSIASVL